MRRTQSRTGTTDYSDLKVVTYKGTAVFGYEIGSWRVASFPEGLARVIETDSPRSHTLIVSTFPTPLSRTGLTSFQVSGSPEKASSRIESKKGLTHFTAIQLNRIKKCSSCHPLPCAPLSSTPEVGRHSYDYYGGSVAMHPNERCLGDPAFRRLGTF